MLNGVTALVAPRLTGTDVSPQVVQMYKETPQVLSLATSGEGGLRWGVSPTLPQSFARVTTSMTVALHPPPLPGAYIHSASDEPMWSPAATPATNDSSNSNSRGPCLATE
jgi:patched 2 protein